LDFMCKSLAQCCYSTFQCLIKLIISHEAKQYRSSSRRRTTILPRTIMTHYFHGKRYKASKIYSPSCQTKFTVPTS
jgi:hypothetical protein